METILTFFESNKDELLIYNKEKINDLYKIILNIKDNNYKIYWTKNCNDLLNELHNKFNFYNPQYIYNIHPLLYKLKNSISHIEDIYLQSLDDKILYKKIKLNIQLLEYLEALNYCETVFCDKEKYDIVIETYLIFNFFNENILKTYVEWYSNQYIIFYSKSINYINICIYELDDLFGYKLFITFRNNVLNNKKSISTYDIIIENSSDFYERLETIKNWKFSGSSIKNKTKLMINIEQIAECFNIKENVEIKYFEAIYIDKSKMLEYVKDFLDN
jgi:hypothetical protein